MLSFYDRWWKIDWNARTREKNTIHWLHILWAMEYVWSCYAVFEYCITKVCCVLTCWLLWNLQCICNASKHSNSVIIMSAELNSWISLIYNTQLVYFCTPDNLFVYGWIFMVLMSSSSQFESLNLFSGAMAWYWCIINEQFFPWYACSAGYILRF